MEFDESDVRNLFHEYGIPVTKIRLKQNEHKGRYEGRYALADLSSEADIQRTFEAIRALDNKKIHGRKLHVKKNESNQQALTTQEM